MTIASLSVTKSLLGITDTSKDTLLTAIISAVDDWIELACNRTFSQANFVYQENGTNDRKVKLLNKPINGICWAGCGSTGVLTVTYSGTEPGTISVSNKTLVVATGLTRSEVNLESSSVATIDDVATAVSALTYWTATASTLYGSYPALSLLDRVYDYRLSTSGQMDLVAAVSPVDLRRVQDGLYQAYMTFSELTTLLIVYNGGYSTYPDGLIYAASKIAADSYSALLRDTAMAEEELGDYSYKLRDSHMTTALQTNWALLLPYANLSA